MRVTDIIAAKRTGQTLTDEQIRFFIEGYSTGNIPDYQAAALLMAVAINGMNPHELAVWTDAMLHSGTVVDLSTVSGVKVDKHSTGGVGDKISLCLAPAVAACGVKVPMISGRGLGHTGGTLDKLEAIPGFNVSLGTDTFVQQVDTLGLCLIGQTENLAPADRKLYALRDVTSTVDSIPLIASSIMSKKLAEGIDALVLDVKVGQGAFMETAERARRLATTLVNIGTRAGKRVTAFLTNMDQVLGREVGNANETAEAIDVLRERGPRDVTELTLTLGAEMLVLGEVASTQEEARSKLAAAIQGRAALEIFRKMVNAQGGDPRVIDDPAVLPSAEYTEQLNATTSGHLNSMDSRAIGIAAMMAGAGRQKAEDTVDPGVGVTVHKKIGNPVQTGEPLATLRHNRAPGVSEALTLLAHAFEIRTEPPEVKPLVLDVIRGQGG
jgi:pyrimidine-nucleoside phosphorylase